MWRTRSDRHEVRKVIAVDAVTANRVLGPSTRCRFEDRADAGPLG